MSKSLISFTLDWGRMGSLDGLFIANRDDVEKLYGKEVYFGEALGKHSEVFDVMTREMFDYVELPDYVVEMLEKKLGSTLSGYNPLEIYLEDQELDSIE